MLPSYFYNFPPTLKDALRLFLAMFIAYLISGGGLFTIVGLYLKYKRPRLSSHEIHRTDAEAELALARADEARMRARKTSAELIDDLNEMLGRAALQVADLEKRLRSKDEKLDLQELELRIVRRQLDEKIDERNAAKRQL
jgi:hypothetical protein